jgi:hypothetical protein
MAKNLGVIVTGITLISAGASFVIWMNSRFATSDDLLNLRSEVQVVQLQIEDTIDARIAFVIKEIGRLEDKRKRADLTATEIQYLSDLNREYERLRKIRGGKEK